jgi:hypothetical protein
MLASIWATTQPVITKGLNATDANQITNLGNSFFFNSADEIIVFIYFGCVIGIFLSALWESANPATFPIGILFLIPLLIISFPLADISHAFYTNSGFANIAGHFTGTEYLSDNAPWLTALITIAYLLFLATRKGAGAGNPGGGSNVVGG